VDGLPSGLADLKAISGNFSAKQLYGKLSKNALKSANPLETRVARFISQRLCFRMEAWPIDLRSHYPDWQLLLFILGREVGFDWLPEISGCSQMRQDGQRSRSSVDGSTRFGA
jgi:hypothetical protein